MRKRIVKIFTGIAIAIVVLGLVYAIAVGVSAAKLRSAYAALEKDGRPMRVEDVIPPEVPETENAALLYKSAALLLRAEPAPEKNLLGYLGELSAAFTEESLDPNKQAELRQLLDQEVVAQALSIVEQGAQRPAWRFERDYTAGLPMLMPRLADLRNLARVLAAKTHFEAVAGQADRAWKLAQIQLRFADALRDQPVYIEQLVRAAMIELSCTTIQKLCDTAGPNAEPYRALEETLQKLDDRTPLTLAADGERLLFAEWLFNLPKDKLRDAVYDFIVDDYAPGLLRWLRFKRATFKPTFLADHATYLRLSHKCAKLVQRPYSPDEAYALDREASRAAEHYLFTRALGPAIGRIREIYYSMIATTHITRAGLALLQRQQAQRAFPDTLDALGLENIGDPFSQESLRYKTEADGFVIYSVGPDQKDNGGEPRQPKQETDYDIVWRFPSPETP